MIVAGKTRVQFAFLSIFGSLCVLFTCLRAAPCAGQDEQPQTHYVLTSDSYGFELKWRPRKDNVVPEEVLREVMEGDELPPSGPWIFNWAARRDPCFLLSGDLPRFALARTFRESSLNPKIAILGDLRIRIQVAGRSYWLDDLNGGKARFFPWGTVHHFSPQPDSPLEVEVRATLVKNTGIAIEIELGAPSAKPLEGTLDPRGSLPTSGPTSKIPKATPSLWTIPAA